MIVTKTAPSDRNILKRYSSLEITFIGTIFSDEELKNIQKVGPNLYFFESDKATNWGINVEKAIKDFTFNTEIGVIGYTDERSIKWKRNLSTR